MIFKPIAINTTMQPWLKLRLMRLNSHGSLFYFVREALRRKRLTEGLHLPLCRTFEREHIKDVIEIPRDHFKSTCASEGLAMWGALPFTQQDEDDFYQLGFDDSWMKWMRKAHRPESRNLLVSGNITNAAKLGKKIRWHFESNSIYRALFPETLPDASCTWTDYSLHVKRPVRTGGTGGHGEGTFDFLGVGSAVQSRHYTGKVIEDDLIGIKESESQALMDKAIDYHQLLIGIFESEDPNHELDELVIGNRWGYSDLNSHLREHESEFRFESHSALGGCCSLHPSNTPIFPEEFSYDKLMKRKSRLGNYKFSCQFLNDPSSPEDAEFKLEWLNHFTLWYESPTRWKVIPKVKDGNVISTIAAPEKQLRRGRLNIGMIVDPNHNGNAAGGRCRHAIVVVGIDAEGNHYLLQTWADRVGYDEFYNKIFEIAQRWDLHKIGVETIASQKYVKHHIEHLCVAKGYSLRVEELKGEVDLEDGSTARKKKFRINGVIAPMAQRGQLWLQHKPDTNLTLQLDFEMEYQTFSMSKSSRFVDQLDAFAYIDQCVSTPMDDLTHMDLLAANAASLARVGQPYSYGVGRIN